MAPPRRSRGYSLAAGSLLAVLIAVLAWWGYRLASESANLRAGRDALEAEDYDEAYERLSRAAKAWPDSGEVQYLAARAARLAGERGEAARFLEAAALRAWPEEAVELERVLLRLGTDGRHPAESELARLVKEGHPDSRRILEVVVPLLVGRFQVGPAGEALNRWLELRPDSAAARMAQGILNERLRRLDEAAEAFGRVARLRPGHQGARLALAGVLLEQKDAAGAAPHIEALLAMNPVPAEAHLLAARRALLVGDADLAEAHLQRLLRREAGHARGRMLMGRIHLDAGRPKEALAELDRAAAAERGDTEILQMRLEAVRRVGTAEQAAEAAEALRVALADLSRLRELGKIIAERPDEVDARLGIAEIHLRNGRAAEALRWADNILGLRPDHVPTHRMLAAYYEKTGDGARAERHRRLAERRGEGARNPG